MKENPLQLFLDTEDNSDIEELERGIDIDSPSIKAFLGLDKSILEQIGSAIKFIPVLYLMLLICPFWLLYEDYILPLYWKLEEYAERPYCDPIPLTKKEKKVFLIGCMIYTVLIIIIICLYYLMEK